jgi:hypothetical protein
MKIVQRDDQTDIYPFEYPDAQPPDLFMRYRITVIPADAHRPIHIESRHYTLDEARALAQALLIATEDLEAKATTTELSLAQLLKQVFQWYRTDGRNFDLSQSTGDLNAAIANLIPLKEVA